MALPTLLAYLLVGLAVAAVLASRGGGTALARSVRFALHAALWPIFLPVLLPAAPPRLASPAGSAYAERIEATEKSLEQALALLGRDLGSSLPLERGRVASLARAMRFAASRVDELDASLRAPENDEAGVQAELARLRADPEAVRRAEIASQRLKHIQKLAALRRQAQADLETAIARAAELSTRLTLLRYEDPVRTDLAAAKARDLTDSIDELCTLLTEVRTTAPDGSAARV